jgi:hypothetical protein
MATITHNVKFALATKDAVTELHKYQDAIISVERTVAANVNRLSGDKLLLGANNMTAAVARLGGATKDLTTQENILAGASKLTASEKARLNSQLTEAIAKYTALGHAAPSAMRELAAATKPVHEQTQGWTDSLKANALAYVTGMATWEGAKRLLGGIYDFLKSAIVGYAEEEQIVRRLTVALDAQGNAAPAVVAGYVSMAEGLERHSTVSHDALLNAQALFVQLGNVGPAMMGRALQAAMDLSAGIGVDLDSAVRLIAKAFEGEYGQLKKRGIVIDENVLASRGYLAVLEAIEKRMGGQAAAAADTLMGSLTQLTRQWDKLKESIGGLLAAGGAVPGLVKLTTYIDNIATAINLIPGDKLLTLVKLMGFGGPMAAVAALESVGGAANAAPATPGPALPGGILPSHVATTERTTAIQAYIEKQKTATTTTKAAITADDLFATILRSSTLSMYELNEALWKTAGEGEKAFIAGLDGINKLSDDLLRSLPSTQKAAEDLWEAIGKKITDLGQGPIDQTGIKIRDGATDWKKWGGVAVSALGEASRAAEMAGNKIMASLMSIGSAVVQGAMQGGVWGAVSSGALAVFGAVSGALFKTEGKKVNDLRDQFIAAAGGLAMLDAKAHSTGLELTALLNAKTVKDFDTAVAALNTRLATQADLVQRIADTQQQIADLRADSEPTWAGVSGAMDQFGITADQLGQPVLQMQANAGQSDALAAIQMFLAAGADRGDTLNAMAPALTAIVESALQSGTTISDSLRPYLESLGTFDLSSIEWGASLQTEMDRNTAALDALTLSLQDLTTQLAAMGPAPVVGAATRAGAGGSGTPVNITIQAWDGASVSAWLRGGGARQITQELQLLTD